MPRIPKAQSKIGLSGQAPNIMIDAESMGRSGDNLAAIARTTGQIEQKFRELRDIQDIVNSVKEIKERFSTLEAEAVQTDDIWGFDQKVSQEATKLRKKIRFSPMSPDKKIQILQEFDKEEALAKLNIGKILRNRQIEYSKGQAIAALDGLKEQYRMAASPAEMQKIAGDAKRLLNWYSEAGVFKKQDAEELYKEFKNNAIIAKAKFDIEANPEAAIKALQNNEYGLEPADVPTLIDYAHKIKARQKREQEQAIQEKVKQIDKSLYLSYLNGTITADDIEKAVVAGLPTSKADWYMKKMAEAGAGTENAAGKSDFTVYAKLKKDLPTKDYDTAVNMLAEAAQSGKISNSEAKALLGYYEKIKESKVKAVKKQEIDKLTAWAEANPVMLLGTSQGLMIDKELTAKFMELTQDVDDPQKLREIADNLKKETIYGVFPQLEGKAVPTGIYALKKGKPAIAPVDTTITEGAVDYILNEDGKFIESEEGQYKGNIVYVPDADAYVGVPITIPPDKAAKYLRNFIKQKSKETGIDSEKIEKAQSFLDSIGPGAKVGLLGMAKNIGGFASFTGTSLEELGIKLQKVGDYSVGVSGGKNMWGHTALGIAKLLTHLGNALDNIGDTAVDYWKDKIRQEMQEVVDTDYWKTPLGRTSFMVAQAIPSLGASMAIALIANPAVSASFFAALTAGDTWERADKNQKASIERKILTTSGVYVGSYASQFVELDFLSKLWTKALPKGAGILKAAADISGRVAIGGASEALQEGVENVQQNFIEKIGIDPATQVFEGVAEAMFIGALTGGAVTAIGAPLARLQDLKEIYNLTDDDINNAAEIVSDGLKTAGELANEGIIAWAKDGVEKLPFKEETVDILADVYSILRKKELGYLLSSEELAILKEFKDRVSDEFKVLLPEETQQTEQPSQIILPGESNAQNKEAKIVLPGEENKPKGNIEIPTGVVGTKKKTTPLSTKELSEEKTDEKAALNILKSQKGEVDFGFIVETLAPKAKALLSNISKNATKAYVNFQKAFAPHAIDEKTQSVAFTIRETLAREKAAELQFMVDSANREKFFYSLPRKTRIEYLLRTEEGGKFGNEQLDELAQFYKKAFDETWEMSRSWDENIGHVENYWPHIWKNEEQARKFLESAKLKLGKEIFSREREIALMRQGMAAGLELKYTNPEHLLRIRMFSALMAKAKADIINQLLADGFLSEEKSEIHSHEIMIPGKTLYGDENTIRLLKRSLIDKGLFGRKDIIGKVARSSLAAKNIAAAFKLGLSAFHFIGVSIVDIANRTFNVIKYLTNGQYKKAAIELVKVPVSPVFSYIEGKRIRRIIEHGPTNATEQLIYDSFMMAGARAKASSHWVYKMQYNLRELVENKQYIRAALAVPLKIAEAIQAPLMEDFVPALKLSNQLQQYSQWLMAHSEATHTEKQKAASQLWDSTDNRFGEMVYDNLFWNRSVRDVGVLSMLSLGWNLGFREAGNAFIDLTNIAKKLARGEKVNQIELDRIGFIATYTAVVALLGGIITRALTGEPPEDVRDYFYPRTGELNADGSEQRLTIPAYSKDFFAMREALKKKGIIQGPITVLSHKLAPIWSTMIDIFNNKDFYGVEIYSPTDPMPKYVADAFFYFLSNNFTPISVSSFKSLTETGDVSAGAILLNFMGFTKAPGYVVRTETQQKIYDALHKKFGGVVTTREEAERKAIKRQLKAKMRAGTATPHDIQEAIESGALGATPAGIRKTWASMLNAVSMPADVSAFKYLNNEDKAELWMQMTNDERAKYYPALSDTAKQYIMERMLKEVKQWR